MQVFWLIIFSITLFAMALVCKPLLFHTKNLVKVDKHKNANFWLAILLCCLIPLFNLVLYFYFGNNRIVSEWMTTLKNRNQVQLAIAKLGTRQEIIKKLHTRLMQLPENQETARGWHILGKLYFNEQNGKEAIICLQKALSLKPTDPYFLLELLSAKFYVYHQLDPKDRRAINNLLRTSPNNVNAINLLALDAYQRKNYQEAIQHWENLLQFFSPGSEDSQNLLQMIQLAQRQSSVSTEKKVRNITLTVTLSPDFKKYVSGQDRVFIYALEVGGPKIPLAVVSTQADRLPITVTLDNQQSMMSTHTLENANKIYIEARVSKLGNALPSKGDLVGFSQEIDLHHPIKPLTVTINQVL
jgi:cytochrome c-type biogenesis protein CcmH